MRTPEYQRRRTVCACKTPPEGRDEEAEEPDQLAGEDEGEEGEEKEKEGSQEKREDKCRARRMGPKPVDN